MLFGAIAYEPITNEIGHKRKYGANTKVYKIIPIGDKVYTFE